MSFLFWSGAKNRGFPFVSQDSIKKRAHREGFLLVSLQSRLSTKDSGHESVLAGVHFALASDEPLLSTMFLGDTFPFFPGILLSGKPTEPQGKQQVFGKNVVEKNGESTPKMLRYINFRELWSKKTMGVSLQA